MKKANYIAAVILLIFGGVIFLKCLSAAGAGESAAEAVKFPEILAVLIMAGSIALIILTRFGSEREEINFNGKTGEIIITIVILLLAFPLLKYLGFIIMSILLCFAFLRLLGNSARTSVIAAVLISISVYIVFNYALNVSLPQGLILRKIL